MGVGARGRRKAACGVGDAWSVTGRASSPGPASPDACQLRLDPDAASVRGSHCRHGVFLSGLNLDTETLKGFFFFFFLHVRAR